MTRTNLIFATYFLGFCAFLIAVMELASQPLPCPDHFTLQATGNGYQIHCL